MPTPDETEFDDLPEVLRLALIDWAREHDIRGGLIVPRIEPLSLDPARVAEAGGFSAVEFQRHCRIGMLKLQARAEKLGLDLSDFIPS